MDENIRRIEETSVKLIKEAFSKGYLQKGALCLLCDLGASSFDVALVEVLDEDARTIEVGWEEADLGAKNEFNEKLRDLLDEYIKSQCRYVMEAEGYSVNKLSAIILIGEFANNALVVNRLNQYSGGVQIITKEDLKEKKQDKEKRLEKERLEQERLERERQEQERLRQEQERERQERERLERERKEQERLERERQERERQERERLERERLEKERLEEERLEKERQERERQEKERKLQEQKRKTQERIEQARIEQERKKKELAEKEELERQKNNAAKNPSAKELEQILKNVQDTPQNNKSSKPKKKKRWIPILIIGFILFKIITTIGNSGSGLSSVTQSTTTQVADGTTVDLLEDYQGLWLIELESKTIVYEILYNSDGELVNLVGLWAGEQGVIGNGAYQIQLVNNDNTNQVNGTFTDFLENEGEIILEVVDETLYLTVVVDETSEYSLAIENEPCVSIDESQWQELITVSTEEETEVETGELDVEVSADFIFANSDSTYLTYDDLSGMSYDECRIARNEIYARKGRAFTDAELSAYFMLFDWYEPTIAADDFSEDMLNQYEKANVELIVAYEEQMGYR